MSDVLTQALKLIREYDSLNEDAISLLKLEISRAEKNLISRAMKAEVTELKDKLRRSNSEVETLRQKLEELGKKQTSIQETLNTELESRQTRELELRQVTMRSGELRHVFLGIPDLEKRNEEAQHDAMVAFDKRCPYCGKDQFRIGLRDRIEIDHFVPVAKGGQSVPWNILPVCKECNRKKRDRLPLDVLPLDVYKKCISYLSTVRTRYLNDSIFQHESFERLRVLGESSKEFLIKNYDDPFVKEFIQIILPEFGIDWKSQYDAHFHLRTVSDSALVDGPRSSQMKILHAIRRAGGNGISESSLAKAVQGIRARERHKVLTMLLEGGHVVKDVEKKTGPGRVRTIYRAK